MTQEELIKIQKKHVREIREAANPCKSFNQELHVRTITENPEVTDANHDLAAVQEFIKTCQVAGELKDSATPTTYSGNTKKTSIIKERHQQLTELKAALAALYVLNERQQQLIRLREALQAVLELRKQYDSQHKKTGMDELIEELGLEESLIPCKKRIQITPEEIAKLNDEIYYACKQNEITLSLSEERLKIGAWADKIKEYPK